MRWRSLRQSRNVEDRRGQGGGRLVGGGLGMLVLLGLIMFFGGDPTQLLDGFGTQAAGGGEAVVDTPEAREQKEFVASILGGTEDVWRELLPRQGAAYQEPPLVLFENGVRSGCGFQSSAVGPFYCPADSTVYLDLGFFRALAQRHDAPGDFAQAYVIAHEIGHHVQNLLGTSEQVQRQMGRDEGAANELSVRLELQADYFAGVWAHHVEDLFRVLEEGDLEEALRAASQIGDDTLQLESQGYVAPDSFTHGTSEQRLRWFRRGFESGDPAAWNPFSESQL